ncbi:MAG: HAMP domain-containing protein [Proteobacteria bacterium]|nr:HAMP domain-containing protein [Pseudomonadota bacterium]
MMLGKNPLTIRHKLIVGFGILLFLANLSGVFIKKETYLVGAMFLTGLILSFFISFITIRSIVKPLKLLISQITDFLKSPTNVIIKGCDRTDEIGEIARSFDVIRCRERERIFFQKTFYHLPISIITTDVNGIITSVNLSAQNIFKQYYQEFIQSCPNFKEDDLVGRSLSLFRDNNGQPITQSRYQRAEFGKASFSIEFIPVFNEFKEQLGAVLCWIDQTQEILVQKEIDTFFKKALDGDFDQRLDETNKDHFIKDLFQNMNQLMEVLTTAFQDMETMTSALAKGDLTVRITRPYKGSLEKNEK